MLLRGWLRWAAIIICVWSTSVVGHAAPADDGTISFAFVGHVVFGSEWPIDKPWLPPEDGLELVSDVAPLTARADLAFANLGVPLTSVGEPRYSRWPEHDFIMRTPPRYGAALRAL